MYWQSCVGLESRRRFVGERDFLSSERTDDDGVLCRSYPLLPSKPTASATRRKPYRTMRLILIVLPANWHIAVAVAAKISRDDGVFLC